MMGNKLIARIGKSQSGWIKSIQPVIVNRSGLALVHTWTTSVIPSIKEHYRLSLFDNSPRFGIRNYFSPRSRSYSSLKPYSPYSPPPPPGSTKTASTLHSKILSKLPTRYHELFQRYFPQSATHPVSYLTSFLILHELTAIVPLFGFWILFWFIDWDPLSSNSKSQELTSDEPNNHDSPHLYKIDNQLAFSRYIEWIDSYLEKGSEFVKKATRRWTWIQLNEGRSYSSSGENTTPQPTHGSNEPWVVINADDVPKFIAQGATSYALVKILAPARVIFSIMLMPTVAKAIFIPMSNMISRSKSFLVTKFK